MALTERQNEILRRLKEDKKAVVTVLAKELYVSEATIRRDLAEMHSMGLIERSHGGAQRNGHPLGHAAWQHGAYDAADHAQHDGKERYVLHKLHMHISRPLPS